ncbi:MAG TPA: nucleotide pyrophosphohydrolase [Candidatus Thermoplasmatota archaeon]|jgi:NTP pyrophosphatase (non-canonical NTP hydrolase)|nr:nucleotide pyrophosphohydrolase [Candidatus Thermoplasmatota archaeon]
MAATLDDLRRDLRAFVAARDWAQFHSPKNLAASVAIEAGELLEQFQWTDPRPEEVMADPAWRERVEDELADVALLALTLSERLGIRLEDAMQRKLRRNEARYPASEYRGSARKAPK